MVGTPSWPIVTTCWDIPSANFYLAQIFPAGYIHLVAWNIEFTDEFGAWWDGLTADEQEDVAAGVGLLGQLGPALPFPYSSGIKRSRHFRMRELRVQHQGRPYRILYAFDPLQTAILLIGGDKTGNRRWYDIYVPIADALYNAHLITLIKEGRLKPGRQR